jgi:hypothetical protein
MQFRYLLEQSRQLPEFAKCVFGHVVTHLSFNKRWLEAHCWQTDGLVEQTLQLLSVQAMQVPLDRSEYELWHFVHRFESQLMQFRYLALHSMHEPELAKCVFGHVVTHFASYRLKPVLHCWHVDGLTWQTLQFLSVHAGAAWMPRMMHPRTPIAIIVGIFIDRELNYNGSGKLPLYKYHHSLGSENGPCLRIPIKSDSLKPDRILNDETLS